MRLLLINPNTSPHTTRAMLDIAREAAPADAGLDGATAPFGAALITTEAELAEAGRAVSAVIGQAAAGLDGIVIAAFGDPGIEAARTVASCPVTGIAEAGMAEAASGGRRFAVATTTPGLAAAIARLARAYGHGSLFRGVYLTPGDPAALTVDAEALRAALDTACRAAIREGAEAVVIGGGPLALAARALSPLLPVPVIEPVPAAIRLACHRASRR